MGRLGGVLERFGGVLGALGGVLGTSWRILGRLVCVLARLGAFWRLLARKESLGDQKTLKFLMIFIKNTPNINMTRHGTGSAAF